MYRELLWFLAWRDLKVRYKQTVLGIGWAIAQPLLPMLLFTLTFGRMVGMASDDRPYAMFVYVALLPWTFFANAVTSTTNSLVGNSSLITKVYFPRLIIPAAAVLSALVDFAIAFVMLLALMLWYSVPLHSHALMLPPLVVLVTVLALGVGMLFSAMSVRYRDVRYALPFCIQVWMFATPVVFPVRLVPAEWQWALALNPLTGVVEGFRSAVLGLPIPFATLAASTAVAISVLIASAYLFRYVERTFADTI
jgi:lipopolysaccharide transport system permease protein